MTAVAGMTSTGRFSGESTSTLANMPGRRRPSWLGKVARTRTLRVATSTSGLMVVTAPSQACCGNTSVCKRTCMPGLRSDSACWGSQKSAWMGWIDCREAISVPEASTCPSSTCRMATRPSKGARMVFLAMVACNVPTLAAVCLARASAASRSAAELKLEARRVRARSRVAVASSASALAAASCASSVDLSSSTITSPRRTNSPESKPIFRTSPGTSEATVTARTATSVPTAVRADCHSKASTFAEVTASGGGTNDLPAPIMARIWPALIPTRITITAARPMAAKTHERRFPIRTGRCCAVAAISKGSSV